MSDEVVRILTGANLSGRVVVPEQIVVHRFGHLVTREEVAEAIGRSLSTKQIEGNPQIKPEDIRLSARITISAENADLRVTRIEMDRSLQEMKFWLVSGAEPTLLPFIAMTHSPCDTCGSAETTQPFGRKTSLNRGDSRSELEAGRHGDLAAPFVEPGKIARLHLISGPDMQMYLTAISLERGTLGQTIRAKIQQTGKILSARVVGRNQLEAEF
jgi:hypothetical protein